MNTKKSNKKQEQEREEKLRKMREAMTVLKERMSQINNFSGDEYKNLERLSKEQLIKIIYDYHMGLARVGEVCVDASKAHIEPDEAVEKIRKILNKYNKYRLYDDDLDLAVDLQLNKITSQEFIEQRQARRDDKKEGE